MNRLKLMINLGQNSKGMVIPFLAISIAVIIGLAALVVDSTIHTASHSEIQAVADLAALGALEAYVKSGADGEEDFNIRVENSRKALVSILAENEILGKRLDGENWKIDDASIGLSYSGADGTKGTVTPGLWFYDEPLETCADFDSSNYGIASDSDPRCPCDGTSFNNPCFAKVDGGASSLNAVRVDFKTEDDREIKLTGFGSVLKNVIGGENTDRMGGVNSSSIAALAPNNMLFAIDMSPSIVYETHFPIHPISPSEYAFKLNDNSEVIDTCGSEGENPNPCPVADSGLFRTYLHRYDLSIARDWNKYNRWYFKANGYKFETDNFSVYHAGTRVVTRSAKQKKAFKDNYFNQLFLGNDTRLKDYNLAIDYSSNHKGRLVGSYISFWPPDSEGKAVAPYGLMYGISRFREHAPGSGRIDRFSPVEATENYRDNGTVILNRTKITRNYPPAKDRNSDAEYPSYWWQFPDYVLPYDGTNYYLTIGYKALHDDRDCTFPANLNEEVEPFTGAGYTISWADILDVDNEGSSFLSRFTLDPDEETLTYNGIQPGAGTGMCGCNMVYELKRDEMLCGQSVSELHFCNNCYFKANYELSSCAFDDQGSREFSSRMGLSPVNGFATEMTYSLLYNFNLFDTSDLSDPKRHARSDYQCFRARDTAESTEFDVDTTYFEPQMPDGVDAYLVDTSQGGIESGPQPLTTLITGVNDFAKKIQGSTSGLDRIGFYAFDESTPADESNDIYQLREFPLASPYSNAGFSDEFEDLIELTDITNPDRVNKQFQKLFFPITGRFTGGAQGLAYGYNQLNSLLDDDFAQYTRRSITLLSDGDFSCDLSGKCGSHKNANGRWVQSWAHARDVMEEIAREIVPKFIEANISINTVVVGEAVNPHKLLYRSSNGGCMSNEEAVQKELPLTEDLEDELICVTEQVITTAGGGVQKIRNTTTDMSGCGLLLCTDSPNFGSKDPNVVSPPCRLNNVAEADLKNAYDSKDDINSTTGESTSRYYFPTSFLEEVVSRPTGGHFIPIMKPCVASWCTGGYSGREQEVKDSADEFCDNSGADSDSLVIGKSDGTAQITDDAGRLVCDILCRTEQEQLSDFADLLFSENPVILVGENDY